MSALLTRGQEPEDAGDEAGEEVLSVGPSEAEDQVLIALAELAQREELAAEFEAEGNAFLYERRRAEAKGCAQTIEEGTHRRCLYHATSGSHTPDQRPPSPPAERGRGGEVRAGRPAPLLRCAAVCYTPGWPDCRTRRGRRA